MNAVVKQYLGTKEAALFLGVSYQALEKGRCGYGKINPPFIRIGRSVRYDLAALIDWMNSHRAR